MAGDSRAPAPAGQLRRAARRSGAAAAIVAGAGMALLGGAAVVETHDPACAACHLPPEVAFVARAAAPEPVDLASAHARLPAPDRLRCVDCHGGPGLAGRVRSLAIGARDAAAWLRGDYAVVGTDYAPLGAVRHPVADDLCLACHAAALDPPGFENHFHHALRAPRAPRDLACVTCHAGHLPRPGSPAFVADADIAAGCQACHAAMGGPVAP